MSRKRALSGLPYYGGKSSGGNSKTSGPWVASNLPWDRNSTYIEPFAGMLGVLLVRRPVNSEIANDLDGNLVNWWRAVRDESSEFEDLIWSTPLSRSEYEEAGRRLNDDSLPPLRRALMYHIKLSQNYVHGTTGTSWKLQMDGTASRRTPSLHKAAADATRESFRTWIPELSDRLRSVQLENRDAVKIVRAAASTEEAVIYCDPPYRTTHVKPYSQQELDVGAFTEAVSACRGRVAISGYGDEWDHLGWERRALDLLINPGHAKGRKGRARTEVLWMNYSPDPVRGMFEGAA